MARELQIKNTGISFIVALLGIFFLMMFFHYKYNVLSNYCIPAILF